MFLVVAKRISEMKHLESVHRNVLKNYDRELLVSILNIFTAIIIAAYVQFVLSPYFNHSNSIRRIALYSSAIPFLLVMFRLLQLAIAGELEQPELIPLKDRAVIFNGLVWVCTYLAYATIWSGN